MQWGQWQMWLSTACKEEKIHKGSHPTRKQQPPASTAAASLPQPPAPSATSTPELKVNYKSLCRQLKQKTATQQGLSRHQGQIWLAGWAVPRKRCKAPAGTGGGRWNGHVRLWGRATSWGLQKETPWSRCPNSVARRTALRVAAEWSGTCSWCPCGCQSWLKQPRWDPQAVVKSLGCYRREEVPETNAQTVACSQKNENFEESSPACSGWKLLIVNSSVENHNTQTTPLEATKYLKSQWPTECLLLLASSTYIKMYSVENHKHTNNSLRRHQI